MNLCSDTNKKRIEQFNGKKHKLTTKQMGYYKRFLNT